MAELQNCRKESTCLLAMARSEVLPPFLQWCEVKYFRFLQWREVKYFPFLQWREMKYFPFCNPAILQFCNLV
jgi:hypothetical protein